MESRKLYLETYGCQMNVVDSEVVVAILQQNKYQLTQDVGEADLVLVNTCSIRDNAEQRVRTRLNDFKNLKKKNKDWLFPRDNGSGHRPKEWLIRNCVRICKDAGVIRVTPHGLRGTWATLAIEQGAPIDLIAPILGHAGYQVTRDHYVAPGAEEQATTDRMMELCESETESEDEDD